MTTTDYLKRRKQTWYVRVQIPMGLWKVAGGKREFVKSLGTRDLHEANQRKHAHIAVFQHRIRALEAQLANEAGALEVQQAQTVADLYDKAIALREMLERAKASGVVQYDSQGRDHEVADYLLSDVLDEAKELVEGHDDEVAAHFHRVLTTVTIREMIETWLTDQAGEITGQTVSHHRSAVNAFLKWAGEHVGVKEVDRRKAGQYVSALLGSESALSRQTVKRHLSSLSSLWRWLEARGHAETDSNPWVRQRLGTQSKHGKEARRQQWSDDELVQLLTGELTPRYTTTLRDLVRLALVTGARIEELCALQTTDVTEREDGWWIKIRQGKTEAAVREVPIHDSAAHVLKGRSKTSDGFVFSGLVPGGPDRKRSWNASKAFGRYRTKLGLKDAGKVFHSLRNTFTEAMEAAEVPESTVKLLVGHKRTSLTFGHYSKGARVKLRESIDKLNYSPDVMGAIKKSEQRKPMPSGT